MTGPLIFLDIDGVLNVHDFDRVAMSNRIDHRRVAIFNRVLSESGASVVLSSAWRYIIHRGEATLDGFDWLLRSHGFMAGRLIGFTEADTMMPGTFDGTPGSWPVENERGRQIARWRHLHRHTGPYVVIDDGGTDRATGRWTDLGIGFAGHPVIWTDVNFGIREIDADRAISILKEAS